MEKTTNNLAPQMSQAPSIETGYLELFIGPMFSGKTSKLLEIYKQCTFCNIPVAVINHSADTRYHDTMLSSHDKVMIPCMQTINLRRVWNNQNIEQPFDDLSAQHIKLRCAKVILINEGQFFEDLHAFVLRAVENDNKHVVVAGLDGDRFRQPFGQILNLIPLADKITKITAFCKICGKDGEAVPALFTYGAFKSSSTVHVGGPDIYMPLCRTHYLELTYRQQQAQPGGLSTMPEP
jgi:thymidine kinase